MKPRRLPQPPRPIPRKEVCAATTFFLEELRNLGAGDYKKRDKQITVSKCELDMLIYAVSDISLLLGKRLDSDSMTVNLDNLKKEERSLLMFCLGRILNTLIPFGSKKFREAAQKFYSGLLFGHPWS